MIAVLDFVNTVINIVVVPVLILAVLGYLCYQLFKILPEKVQARVKAGLRKLLKMVKS